MTAFTGAGVYGKIPAEPEFVRVRAADALASPLVRWLEAGSEAGKAARAPMGEEPVRFLFRPAGAAGALVGILVGSVDRVGRRFPLALFAAAGGADLAALFPALPRACGPFLDAAAALARGGARGTAAELAAGLERLPLPAAADLASAAAEERARAEAPGSGGELLARLFGEAASGQRHYAVHCFRTACQGVRGREPARAAAVLSCPAEGDADRWAWLEMARRGLGWPAAPSSWWQDRPAPRLLVSLGPVPPSLFTVLWQASASDARVWPLVTDKPAAIAAARRALGARATDALDAGRLSVRELVDLVAGGMPG